MTNPTVTYVEGTPYDDEPLPDLIEEIADTATIEQLFDAFILEVTDMFHDLHDVSLEGNAVRTHLTLAQFGEDTLSLAIELRNEMVERIATRSEAITEQGLQLRKQVIEGAEKQEPLDVDPTGATD